MFGEMTEDILQHVQKNQKIKRDVGTSVTKLKKEIKRLERKNKTAKNENRKNKKKLKRVRNKNKVLLDDVSRLRNDNTDLLTSVSWKVTGPLRTIKGIIKNRK